jgi:hypothetical protein
MIVKTVMGALVGVAALLGVTEIAVGPIRQRCIETVSERRSKIITPTAVFIGDSITAAGSPWGPRISYDPFSTITIARPGLMAWQLAPFTSPAAWGFKPKYVSYMAGTNDAGTDRISDEQSLKDQLNNIDTLLASGSKVILTLAPPHADLARSRRTRRMGMSLARSLAGRPVTVIDLWPELASHGILQARYTIDGTHFSEAAYEIWARHLRAAMI